MNFKHQNRDPTRRFRVMKHTLNCFRVLGKLQSHIPTPIAFHGNIRLITASKGVSPNRGPRTYPKPLSMQPHSVHPQLIGYNVRSVLALSYLRLELTSYRHRLPTDKNSSETPHPFRFSQKNFKFSSNFSFSFD